MLDLMNEFILNPQYGGYQRELVSIVCKFFNKKTGSRINIKQLLAQELHKPVIKKCKK